MTTITATSTNLVSLMAAINEVVNTPLTEITADDYAELVTYHMSAPCHGIRSNTIDPIFIDDAEDQTIKAGREHGMDSPEYYAAAYYFVLLHGARYGRFGLAARRSRIVRSIDLTIPRYMAVYETCKY